jgi:uncharacterized protein YegL
MATFKPAGEVPILEGNIVKRRLEFIWLVDYSGSMTGSKIATLNQAIKEVLPEIQNVLSSHPEVEMMMRAIKFSDNASWHVGPEAVPIDEFVWPELTAGGTTTTAQAINLLTDALDINKMSKRGYPPICIMLSDGFCSEPEGEYENAIKKLDSIPWGKKAVRLVIAVGDENDYNEEALLKFVNQDEIGVLKADTPWKLIQYIKWASVTASISSSQSKSSSNSLHTSNVILTPPPTETIISDSTDPF